MIRSFLLPAAMLIAAPAVAGADMLIMRGTGLVPGADRAPPHTFTFRVGPASLSHTFEPEPLSDLAHTWRPGDEGWEELIRELEDDALDATAIGLNGAEVAWQSENALVHLRPNLYGWDFVGMGYKWSAITMWPSRIFGEPVNRAVMEIRAWAVPEPSALAAILASGVMLPRRRR